METFAVLIFVFLLLIWNLIAYPTLIIICFTLFKLEFYSAFAIVTAIIILYMVWMFYDNDTPNRGGRPVESIRRLKIWKHFNNYFPLKLVKTDDLDPLQNYLFCGHPHGLISLSFIGLVTHDMNERSELFPKFKFSFLTFAKNYKVPFSRELMMAMGMCSVSRESMNYLLSQKDSEGNGTISVIIPGGIPEMLDFNPGSNTIQLKNRKGFIKVALQNGTSLVPVFAFGENRMYSQISNSKGSFLRKAQELVLNLVGFPPALFYGRWIILPRKQPVTVVVGSPIKVEKVEQPTNQQIDGLHEKYVNSLTELFNNNKYEYASYPNDDLVIT